MLLRVLLILTTISAFYVEFLVALGSQQMHKLCHITFTYIGTQCKSGLVCGLQNIIFTAMNCNEYLQHIPKQEGGARCAFENRSWVWHGFGDNSATLAVVNSSQARLFIIADKTANHSGKILNYPTFLPRARSR